MMVTTCQLDTLLKNTHVGLPQVLLQYALCTTSTQGEVALQVTCSAVGLCAARGLQCIAPACLLAHHVHRRLRPLAQLPPDCCGRFGTAAGSVPVTAVVLNMQRVQGLTQK